VVAAQALPMGLNMLMNAGKFDEIIKIDDIAILIDPKAVMYLIGTEMDYVDGDFKSGFVFNNPNEKAKCGCGKNHLVFDFLCIRA
jgi:iron-sulfur cluster assembly protein